MGGIRVSIADVTLISLKKLRIQMQSVNFVSSRFEHEFYIHIIRGVAY